MNEIKDIAAMPPLTAPHAPASDTAALFGQPQQNRFSFQPHDAAFAALAPVLGFLFARYVADAADGFLTTLFFMLLYACSAVYIRRTGCKPRRSLRILGIVICAFTLVFSLTASPLLHGLSFLFLLPAIIWRTHAACGGAGFVTRYFAPDLCASVVKAPFSHFFAAPYALSSSVKKSPAASAVKTAVIGVLVTVPLTIVIGALLSSADSGIERIFSHISDLLTDQIMKLIWELFFGIPVGLWLFAAFYSAAVRKKADKPFPEDAHYAAKYAKLRIIPNIGLYAGVTPICLMYLIYVISQTNYFLSAFAGRLPEDMIYSEYARRGFFELCAIAVINLGVILVLTGCAKKSGTARPKVLTAYAAVLCLFTLFIIATALAKMILYISAYGMTPLRVYTTWFMVLLAAVFLVLLVRQFTDRMPTAAVLTSVCIVMLAGLCFSRPDARIAEYNIRRYEQGTLENLDVSMLCDLSEDAYNVMARNRETLERAGKWDTFLRRAGSRTDRYEEHPDKSRNLPAQILLQQLHTDTGNGVLKS